MRRRLADSNRQVQSSAWLVELLGKLAEFDHIAEVCHEISGRLKTHLSASRVIVALVQNDSSVQVMSVTDVAHLDQDADEIRQYRLVANEAIIQGTAACVPWPSDLEQDFSREPNYGHGALSGGVQDVVSVPLVNGDDHAVGVIILLFPLGRCCSDSLVMNFVAASAVPLANQIRLCRRAQRSKPRRVFDRITGAKRVKLVVVLLFSLLCLAAMFVPVTHRISCSFGVEPIRRFYCVAPYDGVLERTLSRPGEQVQAGQLLAEMDGRDIRWELAGLSAERAKTMRKLDSHLAAQESAETVQAELEMKRLDARSALLKRRETGLHVTAPVSGVVLSGDVDSRENLPVKQGDLIYEVAPLEELRFDVLIPDEEFQYVAVGMPVTLEIDGLGGRHYWAKIDRLHPQATVIEGANVFVAECRMKNSDGRLRPGMRGHAKVGSHKRSLGWVTFHRAFDRVARWW
jgi:multidrug resistance efflux pump